MANKWIEHVKKFANDNDMKYNEAMRCPKCKETYASIKGEGIRRIIRKTGRKIGNTTKKATRKVNVAAKKTRKGLIQMGDAIKDTADDAASFAKAVVHGRNDYPPKVRQILEKHGDEVIKSITIMRTPVSGLLTGALSAASLGKFGKNLGRSEYDDLFHLFLEIITENNTRVGLEKNEVINMDMNPKKRDKQESKPVSGIPDNLTIEDMLSNARDSVGTKKFYGYSARDNNCQDFIVSLFRANNIGNEQDLNFIKQDTKSLFKNLPYLRKLSNTLTDIGASVDVITTGQGYKKITKNIVVGDGIIKKLAKVAKKVPKAVKVAKTIPKKAVKKTKIITRMLLDDTNDIKKDVPEKALDNVIIPVFGEGFKKGTKEAKTLMQKARGLRDVRYNKDSYEAKHNMEKIREKRGPRYMKGTKEAKDYMASIRAHKN